MHFRFNREIWKSHCDSQSCQGMYFPFLFREYWIYMSFKAHEKKPRESLLLSEFTSAIEFVNSTLPPEYGIEYHNSIYYI